MSTFSSDDSTCARTQVPSPNEFSRLSLDPYASRMITNKFRRSSTAVVLREYQFLSTTIETLENELERHRDERRALYDALFENTKFRRRIRPIVETYRHRLALKRRGHQLRSRPPTPYYTTNASSPGSSMSDDNSYPSRPTSQLRYPSYTIDVDDAVVQLLPPTVKKPRYTSTSSLDSYHTAIDELPGTSKYNPIIVTDEETCKRCGQTGHVLEDCDTRIRSFNHDNCEVCKWNCFEGIWIKPSVTCDHYDISPAELKRIQARVDEIKRRDSLMRQE